MQAITDKMNKLMEERLCVGHKHVFTGSNKSGVIVDLYHGESITEIFDKLYKDDKIKTHEINSFWKFDEHRECSYLDITEEDMKDLIKFESEYYYNVMNF